MGMTVPEGALSSKIIRWKTAWKSDPVIGVISAE
jgi:hypothetical protein